MKGQISLDLLLSILALVLFIGMTTIIVSEIKQNSETIFLDNELKIIANNYAKIINSSKILDDTNFEIKLKQVEINFQNQRIKPEITINTEKIIIRAFDRIAQSALAENENTISINESFLVITND